MSDGDDYNEEDEANHWEKAMIYGIMIVCVMGLRPLLAKFTRTRGKNIVFHLIYIILAFVAAIFVPNFVGDVLFNETGVLIMGTLIPVYESIVAVCSVGEADDTVWLQFWICNATFTYATEFMDVIKEALPNAGEHWYEFEFFVTLWLMLPFTDGATLIYDKVTEPFIAPICRNAKSKMEGWGAIIITLINSSYLWILWFTFMSLPEPARRFVVVAVGTLYPVVASTVAIATKEDGLDDTHWLTYWSCFTLLFILMDYLETWVGSIRGFYSLCLCATVWLFLPMFQGARSVFRNVLVPLSGQHENMLLHDVYLVRREVEKKIPEKMHGRVFPRFAQVFAKGKVE